MDLVIKVQCSIRMVLVSVSKLYWKGDVAGKQCSHLPIAGQHPQTDSIEKEQRSKISYVS